jgi:outer membrane protein OmpA-like peptidoglycan-associated protein
VDAATLNTRLRNEGLPGTASASNTSRPGWRLFGGYAWNDYLGAEVGYTGLGDIKMSLSGTGPVTETQLKAIRPATGSGVEVAMLGKYPLTERLNGFVRAGLFHWEQTYNLTGSGSGSGSFKGDDGFYGLGTEWRLNEAWSARLSWDRYTVERDHTDLIALGLTYRLPFGEAVPVAAIEAKPALPAAAAEKPAPAAEQEPVPAPINPPLPVAAEMSSAPARAEAPQRWIIHFPFSHTRLTGNEQLIDSAATYLAAHADAQVQVTGHTDRSGAEAFHPYLSQLRAQAVADALAARGVARSRITVKANGAAAPLADNNTREGRRKNRRVEIVIQHGTEDR